MDMDAVMKRVAAAHPSLFTSDSGCWHDCPPGWEALVMELCSRLVSEHPEVRCAQCKSKFGSLRIYLDDDASTEAVALAREYEARSRATCEDCGKPASTVHGRHGWISTLCAEHATENLPAA
jgi:hypothetical protein